MSAARRPRPGQIWRRSDEHAGDATLVVIGEDDPGVWVLQGWEWNDHVGGWLSGPRRLFAVADFAQCEYVGILPPPQAPRREKEERRIDLGRYAGTYGGTREAEPPRTAWQRLRSWLKRTAAQ